MMAVSFGPTLMKSEKSNSLGSLRKELIGLKALCESGRCGQIGAWACSKCKTRLRIIEIKKELQNEG